MYPSSHDENKSLPIHTAREPFLPLALLTLAAPLLWVLHFALLYLLEGFLCTRIGTTFFIPATIALATLVGTGLCLWLMCASAAWPRAEASALRSLTFLRAVQRTLAGLSLLAMLWAGLGAVFLVPCSFAY